MRLPPLLQIENVVFGHAPEEILDAAVAPATDADGSFAGCSPKVWLGDAVISPEGRGCGLAIALASLGEPAAELALQDSRYYFDERVVGTLERRRDG